MPTRAEPGDPEMRESILAVLAAGRAICDDALADRKHLGALSVEDNRTMAATLVVLIDLATAAASL